MNKGKICVVIPSIHRLDNLVAFSSEFRRYDTDIIVVDEGVWAVRKYNSKRLSDFRVRHYGPKERIEWFKSRYGRSYRRYSEIIPKNCHAESSFGFLVAYEEKPDLVIELDDDVWPIPNEPLVDLHVLNLSSKEGYTVTSSSKWYSSLNNLYVKSNSPLFPRGHPYSGMCRSIDYQWRRRTTECVLNMGLWSGTPDLDALTILYHGELNGAFDVGKTEVKREKVVVGSGTYFAICSMNTAFKTEIIPAFYQLYMNHMGIDRFDDIWSGLFIKKITDHLGKHVALGRPIVEHKKRHRSTFKDLRAELGGMEINEKLWKIIDKLELDGKSYFEAYQSLTEQLKYNLSRFSDHFSKRFLALQVEKMKIWLKALDRIT